MITEQLIRHNQTRHQELLREARLHQMSASEAKEQSAISTVLAHTGDLLVSAGQELQRRFRYTEKGVALGKYANG